MVIRYNLNLTNVVHSSMKFSFILSNYEQSSLARLVLSLSLSLFLFLYGLIGFWSRRQLYQVYC